MFGIPQPRWSVTWPTRPDGVWSAWVRADSPTEAVRVALRRPDLPVYAVAFDYEPEVWRLLRPHRRRSYRAAGPDYGGVDADSFTPTPLDLRTTADEVLSTLRMATGHGWSLDEVRDAVRPVVGTLLPSLKDRLLLAFAAESLSIAQYTSTEL